MKRLAKDGRAYTPARIAIDPVASTDELSIIVNSGKWGEHVPYSGNIAILSRREVERLAHQLDRWLGWDRDRQGTPRTWSIYARDLYPSVLMTAAERQAEAREGGR